MADRISNVIILRGAMIGAIIGSLLLTFRLDAAFLYFRLMLIGFSLAPIVATPIAETPHRVGLRYAADTIGLEVGMINLGAALLPSLGGVLAECISLDSIRVFILMIAILMFILHELVVARDPVVTSTVQAMSNDY
ncbi:MAG: hypothetical protein KC615_15995 [Anaerolineae bacterium]|nr:hypothetical protein [Anaerolineae bacterium]